MLNFQDPQVWWFLTRASAMVAWALLTLTMVWGVLLKTRILRGADNPEWLTVTHRYISGLALAMIATHMGTLLLDEYISFGWADILVPFATSFEPFAVALGIFAFWAIILIQITALTAKWLPDVVWKGIHLLSYAVILLVGLHSALVGTDVGTPWYTAVSLVLITTATLAGVVRLVIASREKPTPRAPAISTTEPTTARLSGFPARVVKKSSLGENLAKLTLEPLDPATDLEWEAGAHLTLHLGNGLERQYSLSGDPAEPRSLQLGILNTRGEGGGSSWIHEHLTEGSEIHCEFPRNHFPLKPAKKYQFVASGVGITPIRSMLHSLPAAREWSLLYLGRTRDDMLFADELTELYGDRITLWVGDEQGSRAPLEELIEPDAEVYACGSPAILSALEQLVAPKRLHVERFEPQVRISTGGLGAFEITTSRSGKTVTVGDQLSALETLEQAGVDVPSSCRRGTCGTCEVRVLAGTPEHLDSVMSDADKDELGVMYPCVSRSQTPHLTLDI